MNENIFYTYTGGNGAIYILNLSSFKNISISLEFYKPLGWKREVLKKTFYFYLCVLAIVNKVIPNKRLQNSVETQAFLSLKTANTVDFNVDSKCSLFISSNTDKVIVNHHNNYFEKFSFHKSYKKSCAEIDIYNVLQQSRQYFLVSDIRDINKKGNYCSFKLYNEFAEKKQHILDNKILIKALVEFFQVIPLQSRSVSSICSLIRNDLSVTAADAKPRLDSILNQIENSHGEEVISIGLTHWDFKIWNIQAYQNKVQIYDFEESKFDGLPLEDLYNYHIDSKIMSGESIESVVTFADSNFLKEQVKEYLNLLNIKTSFRLLLLFYLLNRIYFYQINGSDTITNRYIDVLITINKNVPGYV